jgi:protein-tyrosine phosphatase
MFTILFGCTGNRCRSPYAQVHLARLVADLPVEVLSAGTLDVPGNKVPAELVEIARSSGLELSEHRSRYLAEVDPDDIDLFIGFERAHVASAVVEGGIDAAKAFTLPELVRILRVVDVAATDDPEETARAAVAAAAEARGTGFVPGEEIADPFRRTRDVYERVAIEITLLTDELYELLFRRALRS